MTMSFNKGIIIFIILTGSSLICSIDDKFIIAYVGSDIQFTLQLNENITDVIIRKRNALDGSSVPIQDQRLTMELQEHYVDLELRNVSFNDAGDYELYYRVNGIEFEYAFIPFNIKPVMIICSASSGNGIHLITCITSKIINSSQIIWFINDERINITRSSINEYLGLNHHELIIFSGSYSSKSISYMALVQYDGLNYFSSKLTLDVYDQLVKVRELNGVEFKCPNQDYEWYIYDSNIQVWRNISNWILNIRKVTKVYERNYACVLNNHFIKILRLEVLPLRNTSIRNTFIPVNDYVNNLGYNILKNNITVNIFGILFINFWVFMY